MCMEGDCRCWVVKLHNNEVVGSIKWALLERSQMGTREMRFILISFVFEKITVAVSHFSCFAMCLFTCVS